MTAFYLAASWSQKTLMREHRDELVAMGHRVTSRWIDSPEHEEGHVPGSEENQHRGNMDLQDINASSCLLLFTDTASTTGGMHVEFGFALGRMDIMTVVIGPYTNIFQRQSPWHYSSWRDFMKGWRL